MKRGALTRILILIAALIFASMIFTACELQEPETSGKYFINDNAANQLLKDNNTKDDAIDRVTDGITQLRDYLNVGNNATTGYYMGVEFNIDTLDPTTLNGGNFRLKVQAHLFTYPYLDEDGNDIYKFYDPSQERMRIKDRTYYDDNPDGSRSMIRAELIHNDMIKESNILIEWYNGQTNEMLIGMYFDGENANSDDPGNILYLNIQGAKRSFDQFGDTVLYQQLIRLLMNLSVEKLLIAGNVQGDAGVSSIRSLFQVAVQDNYKVVLNNTTYSTLFYGIAADAIASNVTGMLQDLFQPFEDKIDPLTEKYLGFAFSVMGSAVIQSITSDMQFFSGPAWGDTTKEIMTGAFLTFDGAALSGGSIFNYTSDISFDYSLYPPDDMVLDRDFYVPYEYGKYEFVGNLYIPMLNSNFDALIRTDMQQYYNSKNNVFMEYRDIANGELMIGGYYKGYDNATGKPYEEGNDNGIGRTFLDIAGLEYLYGWIDLNELGFPKVYDERIHLANLLGKMFNFLNNGIVSIVDSIISPDKNDRESNLLYYLMQKTSKTVKDPNDIFSKNTETLLVDMDLIKHALEETGQGTYTTRQIINILDSMLPYSMDQIAIMLGVASAEVMLDNSYFTFTLDVDTNEITIKLFTNVGVDIGDDSTLIFQLDLIPVIIGQKVNIAEVNFAGFKPLEQIYTYSATMDGNFIFSATQTVDLSKLLSSTIGENSGLNTPYKLPANAGVTFNLIYDQFVTDSLELNDKGEPLHKMGRSAFNLTVWLTGNSSDSGVILRLASDDVAFNSEVYSDQPARAAELGYVWVSIDGVKDKSGRNQKIPPIKVREDIFMSSMQAYMNGTKISDTAAELGNTEINLSITSIIFALVEDSYVVMEPEQMEITSSNETLQNLFRVRGLIGNIQVDAGFRQRVTGLDQIKSSFGMYQVGYFENIEGNSPYDTALHDTIPMYFYDDYSETYYWLDYDFRLDPKEGYLEIYRKGAIKSVYREPIDVMSGSFWENEDDTNQDLHKIRFLLENLPFVFYNSATDDYCYTPYDAPYIDPTSDRFNRGGVFDEAAYNEAVLATAVHIDSRFVEIINIPESEGGGKIVYIYYLGLMDYLYFVGGTEFVYFDQDMALTIEEGDNKGEKVRLYPSTVMDGKNTNPDGFMFEYDQDSVEITEEAKEQYTPRINGSFMGEIRRYFLTFTSTNTADLSKLLELENETVDADGRAQQRYYNAEDRDNTIDIYDDNGIFIESKAAPIVLYILEPAEDLATEFRVYMQEHNNVIRHTLPGKIVIDWEVSKYLDGYMELTELIIAPGMMGEKTFPVRIVVMNRKVLTNDYVNVMVEDTDDNGNVTDRQEINAPVVDTIEVDPYDFLLAKLDYFMNTSKFNIASNNIQKAYENAEKAFINEYFSQFVFDIDFDYNNSYQIENGVLERSLNEEMLIAYSYTNYDPDNAAAAMERFDWDFDGEGGMYNESDIKTTADGGATYTNTYLHTRFHGQVVALGVRVGQRILSHIKFSPDDDFDPVEENGSLRPGDEGYIYGHYVANYYDENSYTLPTHPILVFTDNAGRYYEKVFDMSYAIGNDENGGGSNNNMSFALEWMNPIITNIGPMGSYYYDTEDGSAGGKLVNRPFYVVDRDENGEIIVDENGNPTLPHPPTEGTVNASDVTSSSINWWNTFVITAAGNKTIHLIKGDGHSDWTDNNGGATSVAPFSGFPVTQMLITVECPALDVAYVYDTVVTGSGETKRVKVEKSDDLDEGEGKDFYFHAAELLNSGYNAQGQPTTASAPAGYYYIDPLAAETLILPSSIMLHFEDTELGMTGKHRFDNIVWRAIYDWNKEEESYYGEGSLTNRSGKTILRYDEELNRYVFVIPTDEPIVTRIMTRIGNEISGYQYITVCVRVLSKEPREVEFYTGNVSNGANGNKLVGIERTDINFSVQAGVSTEFLFYTYYADTFRSFPLPTYIQAFFGTGESAHSEFYTVKWEPAVAGRSVVFSPNSVQNLKTTIGTGDITIDIYLSVVVANHTIAEITLDGELRIQTGVNATTGSPVYTNLPIKSLYVQVGIGGQYIAIGDLLQEQYADKEIGLYQVQDMLQNYIRISMGEVIDNGVEAGKIGLYYLDQDENFNTVYRLGASLFTYEFIKTVYGSLSIAFNVGQAVDIPDVREMSAMFADAYTQGSALLANAAQVTYQYDAENDRDTLNINFVYNTGDGNTRYLVVNDDGTVNLTYGANQYVYSLNELTLMYAYAVLGENYDEKLVTSVRLADDTTMTFGGVALIDLYVYESGNVIFRSPYDDSVLDVSTVTFSDGSTASVRELRYRLNYYNTHRKGDYIVASLQGRTTIIENYEGIFQINDVVESVLNNDYVKVDKYRISLGTGVGAYDLTLNLRFVGGFRQETVDTEEITVQPYDDNGFATYGQDGYVFANAISATINYGLQDGRGAVSRHSITYGPAAGASATLLVRWYVESVTGFIFNGEDIDGRPVVGSFITYLPQSLIYSSNGGTIVVSTLTAEGFRIRRSITVPAINTDITFRSTNSNGLVISNGTITITDMYDYQIKSVLGDSTNIPTTLRVMLSWGEGGGNPVAILLNGVVWKMNDTWINNWLPSLSYKGMDGALTLATAEILGWETFDANGNRVKKDTITLTLKIDVQTAEIVELPWNSGRLRLDTTAIGQSLFLVDVDAYNDASSSAVNGKVFRLPSSFTAKYASGEEHTFNNVEYIYRFGTSNLPLTEIPYNTNGIDRMVLSRILTSVPMELLPTSEIELTVNVADGKEQPDQELRIKFRFYDKAAKDVTIVIDMDDESVRNTISNALDYLGDERGDEILESINQTRIRRNLETLFDCAKVINGLLNIATVNDLYGGTSMSNEQIRKVLLRCWTPEYNAPESESDAYDIETTELKTVYSRNSLWNYALVRMKSTAESIVNDYVELIAQALRGTNSKANVERQLTSYYSRVTSEAYSLAIGDYLKLELNRALRKDMEKQSSEQVNYSSYYKNVLEASLDHESVIREIYRIRDKVSYEAVTASDAEALYEAIIMGGIRSAVASARARTGVSADVAQIVENAMWIKLGVKDRDGSQYESAEITVDLMVGYAANNSVTKQELRTYLRKMMSDACDMNLYDDRGNPRALATVLALNSLIPLIVRDNVDSIQNYGVTVTSISRNLITGVDITSILKTLLNRSISHYISEVYMEGLVAREIKKVQAINLGQNGYYYIDPYYEYRIVPNEVLVDFDENSGGFSYGTNVSWINGSVDVTYSGNARDVAYGYIYSWLSVYDESDPNPYLSDMLERVMKTAADKILEGGGDWSSLTWATVYSSKAYGSRYASLDKISSDILGKIYDDVNDGNRNGYLMKLFAYFLAGEELYGIANGASANELRLNGIDPNEAVFNFYANRYAELNFRLTNGNLPEESQYLRLAVIVNDRTIANPIVYDDNNNMVSVVEIYNPFEYTDDMLPNRVADGKGGYLEVVWSGATVSPEGNINASTHTINGNIANVNGQPVTMELYVARWEVAGLYIVRDGATPDENGNYSLDDYNVSNQFNFYFNNALEYSAQDSYLVAFNVYSQVRNEATGRYEQVVSYERRVFYPEDSRMLVDTVDDNEMSRVKERRNYVIYWDDVVRNSVLNSFYTQDNPMQDIEGSLYFGNGRIGSYSLATLTLNASNKVPRMARYSYEVITVRELDFYEMDLDGDGKSDTSGIAGEVTFVTDVRGTLPQSGALLLAQNNIKYDMSEVQVRILWNRSYQAALTELVSFIAYTYADVEPQARTQYAQTLLMQVRTPEEEAQLLALAIDYVRNTTLLNLNEEEIKRAAEQLLMINERYDYTAKSANLRGGSDGTRAVTILIKYGNSAEITPILMRVRLVFADYTPLTYYYIDGSTELRSYRGDLETAKETFSSLYIAVRMDYWDEDKGTNAYPMAGSLSTSPYDSPSDTVYKMLHALYSVEKANDRVKTRVNNGVTERVRLIEVNNVVYEDKPSDAGLRSVSFEIDGITYYSNLISLPVA